MSCRHVVVVFGAAAGALLGAALFATPVSYAQPQDDLFPPGTLGPIGEPTNVESFNLSPFFGYGQQSNLYHVVDNGTVTGQFTDTTTSFESPNPPFGVWYLETKDVISDSTAAGLSNGATEDDASWQMLGITGLTVLASSHYLTNPGVETEYQFQIPLIFENDYVSNASGTSDIVGLFGQSFTLFDFPAASAVGADTVDANWLTDLAALFDPGSWS